MRTVPKPWGREVIFAENERYAGKVLHLSAGQSLSLQYHERKDETLYVLEGRGRIQSRGGEVTEIRPGDTVVVVCWLELVVADDQPDPWRDQAIYIP